ncbi:MAG: rpsI [Solirubrobacterales bacterium]|nr:rpsI [Solirubrobacterales bacterium]
MADDEKTPDQGDETTEGQAPQDAGPVAESDSSSSQAAGEEPDSTPPASEAPDASPEASAAEDESSDEPAPEGDEGSDALAETADAPAAEEAPAEEPVAEEAPAEKKKDVIPGADLEPIAVEPEKQLSAEEKARLEAEEEEKARREAALVGGDDSEAEAANREPAKMESGSRFLATGKRKCSIARVTLLPGDGKVEVNKRSLEEFFPRPLHQTMAVQPLTVSGYEGNVDVRVRVHGGGISGQAGAVRHGIARALTEIDPELRGELKRRGFLTRDARVKERRKAGFKKARKKPQFSKR